MHTAPNNKRYIGITSQIPSHRWKRGEGYRTSIFFYRAIQKYGWEKIKHEILFTGLSEEEAKKIEIELIKKYDTTNRGRGYNITSGGNTTVRLCGERNGMFGRTHTPEIRKRLSDKAKARFSDKKNHPMTGRKRSKETIAKISESKKGLYCGEKCYFYGKHFRGKDHPRWGTHCTKETKRKISESHIGRFRGEDAYNSRPVFCVETGEIFSCAMDVKRKYGYDNSQISKCCKSGSKTAHGYHWKYTINTVVKPLDE